MGQVYEIHYTSEIPMYLSRYFQNVKDVHHHNTIGSSTNHMQPFVCLLYHQNVELPTPTVMTLDPIDSDWCWCFLLVCRRRGPACRGVSGRRHTPVFTRCLELCFPSSGSGHICGPRTHFWGSISDLCFLHLVLSYCCYLFQTFSKNTKKIWDCFSFLFSERKKEEML